MSDRNRLDAEASPYLQQHADNPVNWQPWDDDALAEARERDVPILLSVGYSACHWCHVMAEESFEDPDVAATLNESFVPVKVDREERPDLDRVYQTVCQLVTGGGGWPLTAWLTPEGKPFYIGTYFPPEPHPNRNAPGFQELCRQISDSWSDPEQREEMRSRAEQWTAAARDRLEPAGGSVGGTETDTESLSGTELLDDAAAAAVRGADRTNGGFGGSGPKFPHPGRIELLLRVAALGDDGEPLTVARNALNAMGSGGLYDHLGGGFHRYCVDTDWTVPHFEKMAYDNAAIPAAFLASHRATGRDRDAEIVRESLEFVSRELTHPDGGFYSTLDARSETPDSRLAEDEESEREEGAFYVWTPEEVREVLDEPTATLFCRRYDVVSGGNFEGGASVLNETVPVEELVGAEFDTGTAPETEAGVREALADAKQALFDARSERPRPLRDEKVLAGWNGLLISTFARAGLYLDEQYTADAEAALGFVRDRLWDADEGTLFRRFKDEEVGVSGYLEDYAFLGRGAFDLYQATGEVAPLQFALSLAGEIADRFYDEVDGTLYFTPNDAEELVARPQELTDQSTPSSVGGAVSLLLDLDGFTDRDLDSVARETLATHRDRIEASPLEHVSLTLAADAADRGPLELTVAADELPAAWRETLGSRYLPGAVIARRPPTADGLEAWLDELGLDEAPPVWANREAREGEPTVYACRSFTCSPPETELDTALEWVAENL